MGGKDKSDGVRDGRHNDGVISQNEKTTAWVSAACRERDCFLEWLENVEWEKDRKGNLLMTLKKWRKKRIKKNMLEIEDSENFYWIKELSHNKLNFL